MYQSRTRLKLVINKIKALYKKPKLGGLKRTTTNKNKKRNKTNKKHIYLTSIFNYFIE